MWTEWVGTLILTSMAGAVGVGMALPMWRDRLQSEVKSRIEEEYVADVERMQKSGRLTMKEKQSVIGQLTAKKRIAIKYHEDFSWGRKKTTEIYLTDSYLGIDFQSPYIQHRLFDRWKESPAQLFLFSSAIIGATGVGAVMRGHEQADAFSAFALPILVTVLWAAQQRKRNKTSQKVAPEWIIRTPLSPPSEEKVIDVSPSSEWMEYSYTIPSGGRPLFKGLVFGALAVSLVISQYSDFPMTQWMFALLSPSLLSATMIFFEMKKRESLRRSVRHFLSKEEEESIRSLESSVGIYLRRWSDGRLEKEEKATDYWLNRDMDELDHIAMGLKRLIQISERISTFEKKWQMRFPQVREGDVWESDGAAEEEYLSILDDLMVVMATLNGQEHKFHQEEMRISQTIARLENLLQRGDVAPKTRMLTEETLNEAQKRLEEERQSRTNLRQEMKVMEQESILKTINHSLDSNGMFEEWILPENAVDESIQKRFSFSDEKEEVR